MTETRRCGFSVGKFIRITLAGCGLSALASSTVLSQVESKKQPIRSTSGDSLSEQNRRLKAENDSLRRALSPSTTRVVSGADIISLIPAALPEEHSGKVTVKYDRFENNTGFVLDDVELPTSSSRQRMTIGAIAVVEGEKIRPPTDVVLLTVRSSSPDWEYLKCNNLVILADGERVPFIKQNHDGSTGGMGVFESISAYIEPRHFMRLAGAAKIEGKLCNTEFRLGFRDALAFRAFANAMRPKSP